MNEIANYRMQIFNFFLLLVEWQNGYCAALRRRRLGVRVPPRSFLSLSHPRGIRVIRILLGGSAGSNEPVMILWMSIFDLEIVNSRGKFFSMPFAFLDIPWESSTSTNSLNDALRRTIYQVSGVRLLGSMLCVGFIEALSRVHGNS